MLSQTFIGLAPFLLSLFLWLSMANDFLVYINDQTTNSRDGTDAGKTFVERNDDTGLSNKFKLKRQKTKDALSKIIMIKNVR